MTLKTGIGVICLCFLSAVAWAGAGTQGMLSENWKDYASAGDKRILEHFDTVIKEIEQKFDYEKFDADSRDEYERLQRVKTMPGVPVTEKDLLGKWKCRSTQPGSLGVFRYPYFDCEIIWLSRGLFIEKISGSQRFSGYLFKSSQNDYVFLGGETVNDDPQVIYSGIAGTTDSTADIVGRLVRKQDRLVLIGVTQGKYYNFFELTR